MMLKRIERLSDGSKGREYQISTDDERKVIWTKLDNMNKYEVENFMDNAHDAMEDGFNILEEINGQWYETYEDSKVKIIRKAYL